MCRLLACGKHCTVKVIKLVKMSDLMILEWSVEICNGMMLLKVATEMMRLLLLLLRRRRRRRSQADP
jgi:hypothetical protein